MYSLSIYSGFWITDIEKMGDRSKCLQIVYKISTEEKQSETIIQTVGVFAV